MSKAVKEAVDFLVKSYGDIQAQAVTYAQTLDIKEVQEARSKVDKGSIEYTVLSILENLLAGRTITVSAKDAKANADSTKE